MTARRAMPMLLVLTLLVGASAAAARDGALDRSFGDGGLKRFSLQPGAGGEGAGALVLLSRGRFATAGNSGGNGFGLSLHRRDGGLVNSFAGDGTLSLQVAAGPAPYSVPTDIARGPGARLLAGGFMESGGGPYDGVLAAFDFTGALDTGFGNDPPNPAGDGIVALDFGGANDVVHAVAVDGKGRTLAVGRTGANTVPSPKDIFVTRRLADGSPDPSFSGGVVFLNPGTDDQAHDVLVLPDGRIIIAGVSDGNLILARLRANGALDPTFGAAGIARVPGFGIEAEQETEVVRDGKGRLVVGLNDGTAAGMSFEAFPAVARFRPAGRLDRTFSGDGRRRILGGERGFFGGIAAAPGGRILVVSTRDVGTDSQIAVTRVRPGGALDKGFGSGGTALIGAAATRESAGALAITRDRRILIAGGVFDGAEDDRLVARLLGDTVAPGTRITSGPRGRVEPGVYRVRFRGLRDTGLRFQCALASSRAGEAKPRRFSACRSPRRVRVRRGRAYRFIVRAVDPAGNRDRSPAVLSFTSG